MNKLILLLICYSAWEKYKILSSDNLSRNINIRKTKEKMINLLRFYFCTRSVCPLWIGVEGSDGILFSVRLPLLGKVSQLSDLIPVNNFFDTLFDWIFSLQKGRLRIPSHAKKINTSRSKSENQLFLGWLKTQGPVLIAEYFHHDFKAIKLPSILPAIYFSKYFTKFE